MSNIKKSGIIAGVVIMVATIIVLIIGGKIMNNDEDEKNTNNTVTNSTKVSTVQTTTTTSSRNNANTDTAGSNGNVDIGNENLTIMEINAAELTEGKSYKETGVIKDKKAYYSDGQVYYALILKTDSNKVLKYYVAYSNYISFDIESQFDITIQEYKDSKGNIAYCVKDIVVK